MIDRINAEDGSVRREMGDISRRRQRYRSHQLTCAEYGRVISFQEDLTGGAEKIVMKKAGFCTVNQGDAFYGCCVECGGNLIEEKRE